VACPAGSVVPLLSFSAHQATSGATRTSHILPDGNVKLEFKRPWSDGTTSIEFSRLALIARLAAVVPPETPTECEASYDNVVVPREDHVASPPQIR
jgi:hypothetical protein